MCLASQFGFPGLETIGVQLHFEFPFFSLPTFKLDLDGTAFQIEDYPLTALHREGCLLKINGQMVAVFKL